MLWLFAATIGWAQSTPSPAETEARALYEQGVRYYEQGEFDVAVRLWEKAYALTPLPAIAYNIAKATEDANHPVEALAAWRAYLAVAPDDAKAQTEARIAALTSVVEALAPAPAPAPAPAVALPAPVGAPEHAEPRSKRGLAAAMLAVGGVGALVGGGWVTTDARSDATALALDGCAAFGRDVLCDATTEDGLRSERTQLAIGVALLGGGVAFGGGAAWVAVRPGAGADVGWTVEFR